METSSIGALVDQLFHTILHPNGREYTYTEVADATGMDASYIRKLRFNQIPNPGISTISALCRFFGVDASYFFPELAAMHGASVDNSIVQSAEQVPFRLALRSTGLTPEAQAYIEGLITLLQQRELPPSGRPASGDASEGEA